MGMVDKLGLGVFLRWQNQMSGEIRKAETDLKNLKGSAKEVTDEILRQAERTREAMERYRQGMSVSMKVAGAGVAMSIPFILAGKAAMKSEQSLADVNSLLVGTGVNSELAKQQMADLQRSLIMQSGNVFVSMRDMEESSYRLVSALGAVQGAAALQPVADLAVAGLGSATESVEFMTSLLATYGERWSDTLSPQEKAAKVANVAAGVIAKYNTNLTELSAAMTYAAGQGSVMGVSLEELSVTIGALQTKGLKSSLAGTALSAYMRRVSQVKTFMESAGDAGKVFKGMNIKDAEGQLLPLPDILEQIEKRFGLTAESAAKAQELLSSSGAQGADAFEMMGISTDNAAALSRVFGDEGSRVIAMLLGQSDALRTQITAMKTSNDLTDMVSARTKNANAQLMMLKEGILGMSVAFGNAILPAFTDFIEILKDVVNWLKEFALNHPTAAKYIMFAGLAVGALTAVAGTIGTIIFFLKMMQAQMALIQLSRQALAAEAGVAALGNASLIAQAKMLLASAAAKTWAAAQGLLNIAVAAFPYAAIVLGITLLIMLIADMIKNWEKYAKVFRSVGIGMMNLWNSLVSFFGDSASTIWKWIIWPFEKGYDFILKTIDWIKMAWDASWIWMKDMAKKGIEEILKLPGIRVLYGMWDMAGGVIKMTQGDMQGGLSQSMKGLFRVTDFTSIAENMARSGGANIDQTFNNVAERMVQPKVNVVMPSPSMSQPMSMKAPTYDYSSRKVKIDVYPSAGTDENKIAQGIKKLEKIEARRGTKGRT